MDNSSTQNTLDQILGQLQSKACLKQRTYKNIKEVFRTLRKEASQIADVLSKKMNHIDQSVVIALYDVNEFEFHLKFGGDLLVFVLKSNIVSFPPDYPIMKSEYINEVEARKYFGSILIYNFMADTMKYHRTDDKGYLIGRMLVNLENHFYIEGVRQLDFLFTDIKENIISAAWIKLFVEKLILTALDTELIGIKYGDLNKVTNYVDINQSLQLGTGQKIGFQMSSKG